MKKNFIGITVLVMIACFSVYAYGVVEDRHDQDIRVENRQLLKDYKDLKYSYEKKIYNLVVDSIGQTKRDLNNEHDDQVHDSINQAYHRHRANSHVDSETLGVWIGEWNDERAGGNAEEGDSE